MEHCEQAVSEKEGHACVLSQCGNLLNNSKFTSYINFVVINLSHTAGFA
jgi:hypothetical protein